MTRRWAITLLLLFATFAPAQAKPALRTYETRYYTIHTDLGRDAAREAELRMTRMAEEYRRRTRDFSRDLPTKLPFYLFKSEADYHAAGGTPNTAGEYDWRLQRLMTFAGDDGPNLATWHTVQHEGFHQFADQVIGAGLPIWVNEGMAEYFGEAIFTGDAFVAGVIPQWRLARVRKTLEADKFSPLSEIMSLSHKEWNRRLSTTNYDHVWSVVHFLVHGEHGSLRDAFAAFLKETSGGGGGRHGVTSFAHHLGQVEQFETKWRAYWTDLPDDPTADLYAEATLRSLTSFFARATAQRQRFESFDAFVAAAQKGEVKTTEAGWLPPALLQGALAHLEELRKGGGTFSIVPAAPRPPQLVCQPKQGEKLIGRFTLKGARVEEVVVERPTKRNATTRPRR